MDYAIIVAGGKGLRMGSDIPKQFLPIGGKPVLMRTLERFREYDYRSSWYCLRPSKRIGTNSARSIISTWSTLWQMVVRHDSIQCKTALQRFQMMPLVWLACTMVYALSQVLK